MMKNIKIVVAYSLALIMCTAYTEPAKEKKTQPKCTDTSQFILDNKANKPVTLSLKYFNFVAKDPSHIHLISKKTVPAQTKQNIPYCDNNAKLKEVAIVDPKNTYTMVPLLKTSWRFEFTKDSQERYRLMNLTMLKLNDGTPIDVFRYRIR